MPVYGLHEIYVSLERNLSGVGKLHDGGFTIETRYQSVLIVVN